MTIKNMFASLFAGVMLLSSANAQAAIVNFGPVLTYDGLIPGQIFVDVTSSGGGTVDFTFYNQMLGATDSTIANIYFQHNGLLNDYDSMADSGAGVDFSLGGSPANLPEGANLIPNFVADIAFGAVPPPATNGIDDNVGEWLTLSFITDTSLEDILLALENGELRIGLHVISIGEQGLSTSLVTGPSGVVPEPSTYALLGSALGLVAMAKRRKVQA
jgi:hypothetical protein